jgi:hypothetical protein
MASATIIPMKKPIIKAIILLVALVIMVFVGMRYVAPRAGIVRGHEPYTLYPADTNTAISPGVPTKYSFSVVDSKRHILKDFADIPTGSMHVSVVRRDLADMQHFHPQYNHDTGLFTITDLVIPGDGEYRIIVEFTPDAPPSEDSELPVFTASTDITVGDLSQYRPQQIGSLERTKQFNGYEVKVTTHGDIVAGQENMPMYELFQNGIPVTGIQEYLGTKTHTVIVREETLDTVLAKPIMYPGAAQKDRADFLAIFPSPGKYKVFTQIKVNNELITTDFVVEVVTNRDSGSSTMDHSTN